MKLFLASLILLLLPAIAGAQIAVGTVTKGEGTTNSLSFAHDGEAGTNRVLGVCVSTFDQPPTGVTYNSVAMTLISHSVDPGASVGRASLYRLVAPATGSNNVVITTAASEEITAAAINLTGVDQTTPTGTPTIEASGDGSIAVASAVGELVMDCVTYFNTTPTATGSLVWQENNAGAAQSGAGQSKAGAASVTMDWGSWGGSAGGQVGVSFKPAGAAAAKPRQVIILQ